MPRRYSIGTLFLLTTMAAVACASIRVVIVRVWNDESTELLVPMVAGGLAGVIYGVVLAVWNRNAWSDLWAKPIGGLVFGTAAGAQMSVQVAWPVLVAAPIALLGMTALVRVNRQRKAESMSSP